MAVAIVGFDELLEWFLKGLKIGLNAGHAKILTDWKKIYYW